jgi:hypothetical protein
MHGKTSPGSNTKVWGRQRENRRMREDTIRYIAGAKEKGAGGVKSLERRADEESAEELIRRMGRRCTS